MTAAAVNGASAAPPIGGAGLASGAPTEARATTLLPAPSVSPCSVDALHLLIADIADDQTRSGKASAERSHAERRQALADYVAAMDRQREAEEGGLLGDLGLDELGAAATVALGAAAVVATGGAALVVVGVALSAASFAVQKTQCFGEASQWVALGLSVGGGVATGAGVLTNAASVGDSARTLLRTAELCAGAAQVGAGARTVEATLYGAQAEEAKADGVAAQHRLARLERWLDEVVAQVKDAQKSEQRGSAQRSSIRDTEAETLLIASGAEA